MKTLADHTIIYDEECPMCQVYTHAFVKTGMLDRQGRQAYTALKKGDFPNLDWNRARTEIALVNRKDHTVVYGVNSLTAIIGNSLPRFRPIFRSKWFQYLISKLYFFISYNRKVIAPGATFEGENSCAPEMNYSYRWAYILFACSVTALMLFQFSTMMQPLVQEANLIRELSICAGQVLFQGVFVALVSRDRWIHYIGHLMTVSLGGALLLIPLFILNILVESHWFMLGYFFVVVGLMFLEHTRRVKILELPIYLSATWVIYRLFVLWIIL